MPFFHRNKKTSLSVVSSTTNNTNSTPQSTSNTTNTKTAEQLQQVKEFLDVIKNGNLDGMKEYIDNGVDKEAKSDDGYTALHCAGINGHLNIVQYLIGNCHVNLEATDKYGRTALHLASIHGRLEIVTYFIETCHVDNESKDNNGSTALHYASRFGHYDIVQYLIETLQVDTEVKDNFGSTMLHEASWFGHLNIVQYLLETCQVDMETKNNNGRNALHIASRWGRLEIVKYLIETCHADNEAQDNDGQTAYDLARKNNNSSVAQYLEKGIDDSETKSVNNTEFEEASTTNNDNRVMADQQNDTSLSLQSEGEPESAKADLDTVPVVSSDIDGTASVESEDKASSSTVNLDSISSTDIIIQNSDSSHASPQAYELNEHWMLKLQDENQNIIDKLNELDTSAQFIDERRDILDLVCVERCNTIDEQNEQSAILASPLHRDFYLLLQRKLKCMIKSCETLSTGMVGVGGGDFRSFTAKTIRENGLNVLRETKLGCFIGNAVTWATKNFTVVPFIDSVGSVFQLIVSLKDDHDRYLGLARVADFATMVCFQQYGTTSLDNAVEKLARWIVRARCGSPSCKFVEEKDEFGKFKQIMINLLADSGDTPAKEQASKAADCAFAHIMKPGKDSVLYDVLYGDTFDVKLDEALAASILGITLDDLKELDSFVLTSQATIPSNTILNNRTRIVTSGTLQIGFNSTSLYVDNFASSDVLAEQESKIQKQEAMIQKQDETIQKLSRQVVQLEKKANSQTNYDAGDGLVYANPAEQFKNEIASVQTDNVMLDQRLRDQATVIDSNESRIVNLEKQLSGLLQVIDTKRDTKTGRIGIGTHSI